MLKIELLKPHTHAGRDYPPGAVLEMDKDNANWLIAIGVATNAKTATKQRPDQTPAN